MPRDVARKRTLPLSVVLPLRERARRASDGQYATADDLSTAARAMAFDQVSYQFLGAAGDAYARTRLTPGVRGLLRRYFRLF